MIVMFSYIFHIREINYSLIAKEPYLIPGKITVMLALKKNCKIDLEEKRTYLWKEVCFKDITEYFDSQL